MTIWYAHLSTHTHIRNAYAPNFLKRYVRWYPNAMCLENENERKRLKISCLTFKQFHSLSPYLWVFQCNSACLSVGVCVHWHCTNSISQNYSQKYFSHSLQLSNWNVFNFVILRIRCLWLCSYICSLLTHSHSIAMAIHKIFRNIRIYGSARIDLNQRFHSV